MTAKQEKLPENVGKRRQMPETQQFTSLGGETILRRLERGLRRRGIVLFKPPD